MIGGQKTMPRKPDHEVKEPTEKHCMGWTKSRNGYCKRAPGHNTWHPGVGRCALHGGAAPTYAAEVHRLRAAASVARYGLPVPIDPQTALIKELERTHGHVLFLEMKVGGLDEADMTGPVGGANGGFPEYKPSVWIGMYQAERKHLEDVAKACIAAGIEERRVKLAEQQGQLIADAITGVLDELVPGWRDRPDAPQVVRKHLKLVSDSSRPELEAAA